MTTIHPTDPDEIRSEEDLVEAIAEEFLTGEWAGVDFVSSFADAGLLTRDAGVVVRLANGAEFQIRIVQSREATR